MNTPPTSEERIWAVLSHLSALAFGMGILLPILGWSEQRRKSKYASFQCLQSLGYQSLGYTIWLLSYLVVAIGLLLMVIAVSFRVEQNGQAFDPMARSTIIWISVVFFGYLALYMLPPFIAAIACALGKDFHYPILGKRLAQYLGYPQAKETEWLVEEQENRWVAAMGHFSILIIFWGMLAPLTTWILHSKGSSFLKFQSIQTAAYQMMVTILYLIAMFIVLLGVSVLAIAMGFGGGSDDNSLFGVGIFFVFSLIGSVILLVIPIFHILGQWAGYRVLKGDDYHYPLIGKMVERWIAKS